jgi:hypothetical protein
MSWTMVFERKKLAGMTLRHRSVRWWVDKTFRRTLRMLFPGAFPRKGPPCGAPAMGERNDDLLLPRSKRQSAVDTVHESGPVESKYAGHAR